MIPLPTSVLETAAGGLVERWLDRILSPAFAFWVGGLTAYAFHRGFDTFDHDLGQLSGTTLGLLAVLGLVVLAVSGALMDQAAQPLLVFLEGRKWPSWLQPLRRRMVERKARRFLRLDEQWQTYAKRYVSMGADLLTEYSELDSLLTRFPEHPAHMRPTRIGNLLTRAEAYPWIRYGLAAEVVWPRLWLVLPVEARTQLGQTQRTLYAGVSLLGWSLAFLVWTPLAWWVPVLAIAGAWMAYRRCVTTSMLFGQLLEAAFDLYHRRIYDEMNWLDEEDAEAAAGSEEAVRAGMDLTLFVRRGQWRE